MVSKITTLDEFEAEYRKGIGTEMDLTGGNFLTEATRDNILNFADAIGDNNPLWTNEEYARKSRFGMITAPPTFLYNVNHGTLPSLSPPGKPLVMSLGLLYAGAELEFYRPIFLGDEISVSGKAVDIVRKQSKSLGPMLFVTGDAYYRNQNGNLIGTIRTTQARYKPPERHVVHFDREPRTDINVKSPDLLAYERTRRGAEPRYWEDVKIGDEMMPVLEKGLLSRGELVRIFQLKAEETIYDLFLWEEGSFRFVDDQLPTHELVPMAIDLNGITMEGLRRKDAGHDQRRDSGTATIETEHLVQDQRLRRRAWNVARRQRAILRSTCCSQCQIGSRPED